MPTSEAEVVVVDHTPDQRDVERDIATTVDTWIAERRENRKAETTFSNSIILNWRSA